MTSPPRARPTEDPKRKPTHLQIFRRMRKLLNTPERLDRKNMASDAKGLGVDPLGGLRQAQCPVCLLWKFPQEKCDHSKEAKPAKRKGKR